MKILVACEESQAVTKELRKLGHQAFSCDLQPCTGGQPDWHIQDNVIEVMNESWDMMIAFPPCTHLAVSGARHFEAKRKDGRQQEGIDFFMEFVNAPIEKIAIENPIGIMSNLYRKPDQIVHPYFFGDPYSKSTCLWLKNLPQLFHAKEKDLFNSEITHTDKGEFVTFKSGKKMSKWYAESYGNGKQRSKTFSGIAKAMAKQWTI